jgi:hypothetical protein
MIIVDQQGKSVEVIEIVFQGLKMYGKPKKMCKPNILLGTFLSEERTISVFAEIVSINSIKKNEVYTVPAE